MMFFRIEKIQYLINGAIDIKLTKNPQISGLPMKLGLEMAVETKAKLMGG